MSALPPLTKLDKPMPRYIYIIYSLLANIVHIINVNLFFPLTFLRYNCHCYTRHIISVILNEQF